MKRIGLIGGLSPESTVHYYQMLCADYNRETGGLNFPEILLESLNLQKLVTLFERDDWEGVAEILQRTLENLERGGAEFAAILANTPHNAYERVRETSPLPIVTIMDATAASLVRDHRRQVGLLGTKATMEYGFFQRHFSMNGIETLTPPRGEREELDRIIWKELAHGKATESARTAAQRMLADFESRGADAVILGCTELPLLLTQEESRLPLYDTARIHATAILSYALSD